MLKTNFQQLKKISAFCYPKSILTPPQKIDYQHIIKIFFLKKHIYSRNEVYRDKIYIKH